MRTYTTTLCFGLILCLSACNVPLNAGYVTPLSSEAAARVAYDITSFVEQRVPTSGGAISVSRPAGDTVLWPKLTDDLRSSGYRIAEIPAKHHLRFTVATLPDGTFVRATLDGVWMAELYHPDTGNRIEPSGSATVTEVE